MGSHVVLLIANIQRCKALPSSFVVDLCDGAYIMKCFVSEKLEQYHCDRLLIDMITSGQLKPGDKYHFQGLYLQQKPLPERHEQETALQSEHFYL